jgi:hypothetical protein
MKKLILAVVAVIYFFLSCRKKEEIDITQYKATGYLLGAPWQASRVVFSLAANNTLSFGIVKYNELGELRQSISLQNLNISKDTIFLKTWKKSANWVTDPITPTAIFSTFLSDGHVLGYGYDFLEDKNFKSWVVLKKVSEEEISGTFQVAFVLKESFTSVKNTLPDSLYFTKGEFFARLNQ